MDLYEALYTTRAMRRVKPDPVPDDVVAQMVDAAVRSPSGGNMQNWRFITVADRAKIAEIGVLYRESWAELNRTVYAGAWERAEAAGDEQMLRILRSSQWLAENFDQVPLVVLAYHRNDPSGASIYPAVWSLMLAARGRGVGTALTTILGAFREKEVAAVLGVPLEKGWTNAAAVTCGYPLGRWGLAKRPPAHRVAYADHWGAEPAWTVDESLWDE
jgi:nitroreductase